MTTTTFTFRPENYQPNVVVNLLEKLQDMNTVKSIVRKSATRIVVDCKSKRGMRSMLHRISYEAQTLRLVVSVPAKEKKYNPYF